MNQSTDLFNLYENLNGKNVVLNYVGLFNFNISNNLLIMFKKHVNQFNIKLVSKKKLYNIMVEALDNVCKHNAPPTTEHSALGMFFLEHTAGTFTLTTGNLMLSTNVDSVQAKLELTNRLDAEALKQNYKDSIVNGTISEQGTAGIGFFDICMKSGNKLEYSFNKVDDIHHFFTLKIKILTEKN
jgi:hypothetical protein